MKKKVVSIIILCTAFLIQLSIVFVPTNMMDVYFNLIRPIAWVIMLIFAMVLFEKDERLYKEKSNLFDVSILGVVLYLFVMVISGVFLKFSYNPLEFSLRGFLVRFWAYLLIVVIREYLRSKIMTNITHKRKWIIFLFVTLIFAFTDINNLKSVLQFNLFSSFDYLMTSLLPIITLNLFLTYTASKGGLESNLIYSTVYYSVPLFSPVLPGISKILDATISYTIVFIMYIVQAKLEWNNKKKNNARIPDFHWKWLIFPGIVFLIAILLGLGVFPFMPVAVASDSMKPEFQRGDLIIVNKIKQEDIGKIEEGDILQYRTGNISVIHRVIEINEDYSGNYIYITKGDNNEAIDIYPVKEEQIIGVAKYKIPYFGWFALVFKSNVSHNR